MPTNRYAVADEQRRASPERRYRRHIIAFYGKRQGLREIKRIRIPTGAGHVYSGRHAFIAPNRGKARA